MPVPLLLVRTRAEVPARAVPALPDRDRRGLREGSTIRAGEVLGLHEVLQARGRSAGGRQAAGLLGQLPEHRGL